MPILQLFDTATHEANRYITRLTLVTEEDLTIILSSLPTSHYYAAKVANGEKEREKWCLTYGFLWQLRRYQHPKRGINYKKSWKLFLDEKIREDLIFCEKEREGRNEREGGMRNDDGQ